MGLVLRALATGANKYSYNILCVKESTILVLDDFSINLR